VSLLADIKNMNRRNMIILMAFFWYVVTLPLPWMVTGFIDHEQLSTLQPIFGFISIPFVALGVVWTLKPELTT